jgi:hypothetical protein
MDFDDTLNFAPLVRRNIWGIRAMGNLAAASRLQRPRYPVLIIYRA